VFVVVLPRNHRQHRPRMRHIIGMLTQTITLWGQASVVECPARCAPEPKKAGARSQQKVVGAGKGRNTRRRVPGNTINSE